MKNADKIFVANRAQQAIVECELKGQISDGMWENSRPYNHWKRPCNAEVVIAQGDQWQGVNFTMSRRYNFTDRMLLDVVGDRMVYWVRFYTAFPEAKFEDHWSFDMSDGWPEYEGEYWDKKRAEFLAFTGAASYAEAMEKINKVPYTRSDLHQDLLKLKVLFHRYVEDLSACVEGA